MPHHEISPKKVGNRSVGNLRAYFCILALIVGVTGLWHPPGIQAEPEQKVTLALDNYGGYSHGGRRLKVFGDQRYEQETYTDVVRDQKVRRGKCALDLKLGQLRLDTAKKDGERLFRVTYDGKEYWVHEDEMVRVNQPGERWLRQISLRNKQ